jgi:hypothetical protein
LTQAIKSRYDEEYIYTLNDGWMHGKENLSKIMQFRRRVQERYYTFAFLYFLYNYNGMGLENLYVREAPLIVTHSVSGSVPSCSFVAPVEEDTAVGTVIGIVVSHLLPPAV